MSVLASFVAGRRTKWVVLGLWVVLLAALAPVGSKLVDETQDDTASFLPESAESTEVVEVLDEEFSAGETTQGLLIYHRDGGLTPADEDKILADAKALDALSDEELPLTAPPVVPVGSDAPPELVSPEGDLAYTLLTVPTNFEEAADWGTNVREATGDGDDGLEIFLSGDLGFSVDAEEVFSDFDLKLLIATALLVLLLLGLIYRALLVAITPLVVVFFAYSVATAFVYLYAKSGATVSSNGTSILIVLMFGITTDYCLLMVSRYREELHQIEDKHEAMQRAVSRTGPAILASGMTVALAMLTLTLADAQLTSTLGPVAAIGVATGMVAGLTLLPALLVIFGRKGFWPRQRLVAYDPQHAMERRQGIWRRVGDRVLQRPGPALALTTFVFVGGALGILAYKVDYSTTNFFKKSVESVEGFELIEQSFPAGLLFPTTLLIESTEGPVSEEDVATASAAVEKIDGVATTRPTGQTSDDESKTTVDVILEGDPFTKAAFNVVPEIRDSVSDLDGLNVLVGGGSAIQYDFDEAIESDLKLIAPIALLVIALILAILLRALVAPLVLIASVVLSFLCTLGLSVLFIRFVVGDAGLDASIPTFAFIFLVALGIDYTIFLMARVREEARHHGTREGMLRAISATGPVITSAGIILAGTFSVLMTLPVTFTFDLGFMVALGILLDTFIVRTIMVPAAVELIGDKIWWPSTAESGGALHEETEATDPQ
ncbi:MAG TPA: MMPL family transporter [Solirubrobacterales bacterium]|nr:MMPL family transporter [Solirubrobacterales bacterium]